MTKPRLLIYSELEKEFMSNVQEIKRVKDTVDDSNYKMAFIYSYSLFEGALNQLAKTIGYAFPERLLNQDAIGTMAAESFFDFFKSDFPIDDFVDYRLLKMGKNDLVSILQLYNKLLDIDFNHIASYDKDKLILISRARNNLIHSHSLAESSCYHVKNVNKYIKKNEALNHIDYILVIMDEIINEAKNKYSDFTFQKLFEDAVKYTMGDCLGRPFYKIEKNKYVLDLDNCEILSKTLSFGESYVLGWWMYQYSDTIGEQYGIRIWKKTNSLDEGTISKIKFIKEFGKRFPFALDGQTLNSL